MQLREAGLTPDGSQRRAAAIMRTIEMGVWRDSDIVLYPSDEEADLVRALAPSVTVRAVVPYAFAEESDASGPPNRPDENWIVFVAGFGHPPNAEAARWFVWDVLPAIVARVPSARFAIVGSNPPASIEALGGPNVSIFANVTDAELLGWYRRAAVAVVPLLSGAGVKLKTVEALWHGLPVVLTPAGAQGLPGIQNVVPVESDPGIFATEVADLLTDDALWHRSSAAQSAYARGRFSEAAQRESLRQALDIVTPPAARRLASRAPAKACTGTAAMA